MVATERMKLAETVEELEEAQAEKEALRSALKLMEKQRGAATQQQLDESFPPSHPLHGRSLSTVSATSASSAIAIKSPPSYSAPSSPVSARRLLPDPPASASAIVSTPKSAVYMPSARDILAKSPTPESDPHPESSNALGLKAMQQDSTAKGDEMTEEKLSDSSLDVPSSSSSSSSSYSPNPSPSSSGLTYLPSRPVVFYEGDGESPWADARSATASPATTIF